MVLDTKSRELFFSYNVSMDKCEVKFPQLIFSGDLFNRYKIFFPLFCHIGIDLLHLVGPECGPLSTCLFTNQYKSFTLEVSEFTFVELSRSKSEWFCRKTFLENGSKLLLFVLTSKLSRTALLT